MNRPLTGRAEHLFNLKFAAKELQRNSRKCDKEEKSEKNKVKQVGLLNCGWTRGQGPETGYSLYYVWFGINLSCVSQAIQKGNVEAARIHAENAIRQKHQSINFLRMSARVDAVASRVQTAVTMNQVWIASRWFVEKLAPFL